MATTTHRVTLQLEEIAAEEYRGRWAGPLDPHAYEQNHYRATLTYQRRSATFRFSTGSGWNRPPVAREVLESALNDAAAIDGAETLEEARDAILENFGETPELESIARGCMENAKKLRRLLDLDYAAAMSDPNGWTWSVTDDPLETLNRSDRQPGTRSYSGRVGTHRDGYPVRVSIELRDRDGFAELAISTSTPYSGGQARDELEGLAEYAAPWTAEKVAELAAIWDRWHLNGMNAACEHQRAAGWDELAAEPVTLYHYRTTRDVRARIREAEKEATAQLRAGATVSLPADVLELASLPASVTTADETPPNEHYEPNGPQYDGDSYNRPSEKKTRGWVRPDEHPAGLLTKPCPECGYRYGTEWRKEELPADVLAWLETLPGF